MYQWEKLKDRLLPQIEEIRPILKKADEQDEKTRDVRPLMSLLMRIAESDARLAGHMLTRRTAVTAFSWQIVPDDPKDVESAQKATVRLRNLINRLLQWHTDTPSFGASAVEINWLTGTPNGTSPEIVRRYKPVEIEATIDGQDAHESIQILGEAAKLERTRFVAQEPPERWIVDIDDSHQAGGILRRLIYTEILRNDMTLEWGNVNKRYKGLLEFIYREGTEDSTIAVAAEAAKGLAKDQASIHSDDILAKFTELVAAGAADSFDRHIGKLDSTVAIAFLGQANTAELPKGGGSRAALQVLQLIRADIHYDDLMRVERVVNEQVLRHDFRLNFDLNATSAPWRFKILIPEEIDLEARSRVLAEMLQNRVPVMADEAYSWMGLTRPPEAPDVLTGTESLIP